MKRFYVHVSSFESAFEKRPEVLKAVSVNFPACIAFKVVDYLAVIIFLQIVIGHERIGANCRACLDMLSNIPAKLRSARRFNNVQDYTREFITLPALKNA